MHLSQSMVTLPEGRPTACFVDLNALRWNFRQIRCKVGPEVKILSMVKANGYGHGAAAVAKALAAEGSDAFGVATAGGRLSSSGKPGSASTHSSFGGRISGPSRSIFRQLS